MKQVDTGYQDAISKGNSGKALAATLKGKGGYLFLQQAPDWLSAPVFNLMMKAQMKSRANIEVALQSWCPTLHQDRITTNDAFLLIQPATFI